MLLQSPRDRPETPSPFKPMGTYLNRHDADEAAQAMNRQMLGARWESCQDGSKFAIRRIS
jgi:hypothetical protein